MINALKAIFAVIISFSKGAESYGNAFALSGAWAEEGMQGFVDQAKSEREVARIQHEARVKVAKARAIKEAKAAAEAEATKLEAVA